MSYELKDMNLGPGDVDEDGHRVVIAEIEQPSTVKLGDTITIRVTPYITVRGECTAIRNDGVHEAKAPDDTLWCGTLLTIY